jgi:hypothetical protein
MESEESLQARSMNPYIIRERAVTSDLDYVEASYHISMLEMHMREEIDLASLKVPPPNTEHFTRTLYHYKKSHLELSERVMIIEDPA